MFASEKQNKTFPCAGIETYGSAHIITMKGEDSIWRHAKGQIAFQGSTK